MLQMLLLIFSNSYELCNDFVIIV